MKRHLSRTTHAHIISTKEKPPYTPHSEIESKVLAQSSKLIRLTFSSIFVVVCITLLVSMRNCVTRNTGMDKHCEIKKNPTSKLLRYLD